MPLEPGERGEIERLDERDACLYATASERPLASAEPP
jgi:hypothetical protein